MCNANNIIHEFNVVAAKFIHWWCIESICVFSFVGIIGILLCNGNNLRTWFSSTKMGASCKHWPTKSSPSIFTLIKLSIFYYNTFFWIRIKGPKKCFNFVLFVMVPKHLGHIIAVNASGVSRKWTIIVHGWIR